MKFLIFMYSGLPDKTAVNARMFYSFYDNVLDIFREFLNVYLSMTFLSQRLLT